LRSEPQLLEELLVEVVHTTAGIFEADLVERQCQRAAQIGVVERRHAAVDKEVGAGIARALARKWPAAPGSSRPSSAAP
jgi:hypothetical protein